MTIRPLAALLVLLLAFPAEAAPPTDPKQKLNGPLRRAVGAPQARLKSLAKAFAIDADRRTASVMVRLRPGADTRALKRAAPRARFAGDAERPVLVGPKGAARQSPLRGLVRAVVPIDQLETLAAEPDVQEVYLSVRYRPLNDVARSSHTSSGGLYLGTLNAQGEGGFGVFDGSGTMVGIIDTGLDFRHEDFITGSGATATSRILKYWDQTYGNSPPTDILGDPYVTGGTEWTQAQLTADIRNPACLANQTNCVVKSVDSDGHGTHVAGSAAGDGSATAGSDPAGKYKGMAPAADLVIVQTDFSDWGIYEGVDYIYKQWFSYPGATVVNMSLGTHLGPHDGTSFFETDMDFYTGAGFAVVAAAGNEGDSPIHASRTGAGTIKIEKWNVGGQYIDFWHPGNDAYTIAINTPDQSCGTITVSSGTQSIGASFCNVYIEVYNNLAVQPIYTSGTGREILVYIEDSSGSDPLNYTFTFTRTLSNGTGRIDGWLIFNNGDEFSENADASGTVGMPATSPDVIAVGAYVSRSSWKAADGNTYQWGTSPGSEGSIATFSSRGPSRDGRTKPDLAAPGTAIISSLSSGASPFTQTIVPSNRHHANQGTSMASPIVTGAAALLFQQDPSLTRAELLAKLQKRSDAQATGLPNNSWGAGKLWATPPAWPSPPGLAAQPLTTASIRWTWQDISNETTYTVLRNDLLNLSGTLGAGTTTFDQAGLSPNQKVRAGIVAGNDAGNTLSAISYVDGWSLAAAPSAAATSNVSSTTVQVSWNTSSNDASTAYEVSASTDGFTASFSTPVAFGSMTGSTATVSGLQPYTTYTFRVRARNGSGTTTAFAVSASTRTNASLPGQVPVTGVSNFPTSIDWSWAAQTQAVGYELVNADGSSFGTFGAAVLTTDQDSLLPNTPHGMRLRVTNTSGVGPLGPITTVYTLAKTPNDVHLDGTGTTALEFVWSGNGNPAGTYFTASLTPAGGSVTASSRTLATATEFLGLTPNTSYTVTVRAENGDGLLTAAGAATGAGTDTGLTQAAAPSGLSAVPASSTSLRAQWSLNGNPSDTEFLLAVSTDSSFAANVSTPMAFTAAASYTAGGLLSGATYHLRVQARNRAGQTTAFATASAFLASEVTQQVVTTGTATVEFGGATLDLPASAFGQNVQLKLKTPDTYPSAASHAAPLKATGVGIEITNDLDLQPNRPLTLTMCYADGAASDESRLVIARFLPASAAWLPLASAPDPAGNCVSSSLDHLSLFQVMQVGGSGALSAAPINAYPNPVRLSRGESMTFSGLPTGTTLKVFTFRGDKVRSFSETAGLAVWNGRNDSGSAVASGVYLVLIEAGGDKKLMKVMVER